MLDFSYEGSNKCFGVRLFDGRNNILLLGGAQKLEVIFSKICIILITTLKNYGENFLKNAESSRKCSIFSVMCGKQEELYTLAL